MLSPPQHYARNPDEPVMEDCPKLVDNKFPADWPAAGS